MGLLDDAIREHLDLKRLRGADPAEVVRQEREALGASATASRGEERAASWEEEPAATWEDEESPAPQRGSAAAPEPELAAEAERGGGPAAEAPKQPDPTALTAASADEAEPLADADPPTVEVDIGALLDDGHDEPLDDP
jgi:hypothetical protein